MSVSRDSSDGAYGRAGFDRVDVRQELAHGRRQRGVSAFLPRRDLTTYVGQHKRHIRSFFGRLGVHKSRELAVAPAKVTDRVRHSQRDRPNRRHARVPVRRAQLFAQFFERSVPRRKGQRRRTCSRDFAPTRFDRSDPLPHPRILGVDVHLARAKISMRRNDVAAGNARRRGRVQTSESQTRKHHNHARSVLTPQRQERRDAQPCNPADRPRARHSLARGTPGPWIAAACHHPAFSAEPVDRPNDERATQRSRHHRHRPTPRPQPLFRLRLPILE